MRTEVAEVLIDIEAHLRQLNLWQRIPPSREALASTQPFCVDTLTLPQWLQFIFIPTLYSMIESGEALPSQCGITPMAQECFRDTELAVEPLLASLQRIDGLLTDDTGDEKKPG